MKENLLLSISSSSGIEAVTKRELFDLGYAPSPAVNGRINLEGGPGDVARCNLCLATAGRVLIIIGSFKAETFDELFEGAASLDFENYIPKDGEIIVSANSVKSKLFARSSIQAIAKKAIVSRLAKKYNLNSLPESGERYRIEVNIQSDAATIYLDTSGEGLHKRGYRDLASPAPLKETLAAALVLLSGRNNTRPLADVFCGSGTIPIEAARIASGIPPGLNRKFDFLEWKDYPRKIFDDIKAESLSKINYNIETHIAGYDIDEKQIKLAMRHAKNAGVDKLIHLQRRDMREFSSKIPRGAIISNPPYGERLSDEKEVAALAKDLKKFGTGFRTGASLF
jgi:Predicted N6-adenine-specific DNA methylase